VLRFIPDSHGSVTNSIRTNTTAEIDTTSDAIDMAVSNRMGDILHI
jgi:hypothetical protein